MNNLKIEITQPKKQKSVYHLEIPATWSELTPVQFLEISKILFPEDANAILSFDAQKQKALCALMQLKDKSKANIFDLLSILNLQVAADVDVDESLDDVPTWSDLFPLIDWIFEKPVFNNSLFKIYLDWVGPENGLEDFTLERYGFADAYFMAYIRDKQPDTLDALCAVLYRPRDIEFAKEWVDTWIPDIASLPIAVKNAMLLNFIGMRNQLVLDYPLIFPQTEEKETKDKEPDFDPKWSYRLLIALPTDQFGTLTEKKQLKLHDAFEFLTELKENPPK